MHLPQTVEYALRVMTQIAWIGPFRTVRAKDLSQQTAVPSAFLSKVLRRLVKSGLIKSRRGHGGGFVLSRPMEEIHIKDILLAVDYKMEETHCLFGFGMCHGENPCPLHESWSQVKMTFQNWAEKTTLDHLSSSGLHRDHRTEIET